MLIILKKKENHIFNDHIQTEIKLGPNLIDFISFLQDPEAGIGAVLKVLTTGLPALISWIKRKRQQG